MTDNDIIEKIKQLEYQKSEELIKGNYERASQIRDQVNTLKNQLKKTE